MADGAAPCSNTFSHGHPLHPNILLDFIIFEHCPQIFWFFCLLPELLLFVLSFQYFFLPRNLVFFLTITVETRPYPNPPFCRPDVNPPHF